MKTILLVEDDPDTADLLLYLFTTDGFTAVHAADGKVAFEYLSRHAVDAVLTDIMMPRMDGLQLVEAIREKLGLAGLPILVHSTLSEEIARATGKRFDAFVRKPCRGSDLVAQVRQLINSPSQGHGTATSPLTRPVRPLP